MKTLLSLCLVGLVVAPLFPLASAHGVCTGLPPRFGRLDDVHFSSQTVQTGDTIIITGNITMMVQQDLQGYLSIHSIPSPHARWTMVSTQPSEKMINVTQFSKVPFSMTIKALQPGTYKLSPILYVPEIGPAFGMLTGCNTEPVVTVTGKSICNTGFVSILKAEDGSSFCVKPDTAQILIERGWAKEIVLKAVQITQNQISNSSRTLPNPMAGLRNNEGIVNWKNQTYYFETPNYTKTTSGQDVRILFHNVVFTLLPSGFGDIPLGGCEGTHYFTYARFADGTSEELHVFVGASCGYNYTPIKLSTHTNPQAGLTVYDGKMKLLVNTENK